MASTAKVIWQCQVEGKGEGDQWKDFNEDESRKLEDLHKEQKNEPNSVINTMPDSSTKPKTAARLRRNIRRA